MIKKDILFRQALLDGSNHVVKINEITKSFALSHSFSCPHCHNEMYATFGPIYQPHFRHNGDNCKHEQYLHDLAEYVFYEEYNKCLNAGEPFELELRIPKTCNSSCVLKEHVDCREHYISKIVDLTKEYTEITREKRVNLVTHYRRPDILLESLDGKQLWIEIWVSHETELDKHNDGHIVEIKIESEDDLEIFRQHKLIQSIGEERSVRLFNTRPEEFEQITPGEKTYRSFPCERYFCFDVRNNGTRYEIHKNIRKEIPEDVFHRIIMRLNWKGSHDTITGKTKMPVPLERLRNFCEWRDNESYYDKEYDSLIVFEWKRKQVARPSDTKYSTYRPYERPYQMPYAPISSTEDISMIEWVDLGLPSGTLWAKTDIASKMIFYSARKQFGMNLPSKRMASELKEYCQINWDDHTHSLRLTGPNGNTIDFHVLESDKVYWLNSYEEQDTNFGNCFHIGPDKHFWINDKDSKSLVNVRLVKKSI